jgi:hypothetical protein
VSHIQIDDIDPIVTYQVTTARTVFPVPFAYFETSNIVVTVDDDVLVLGADYSISGTAVDAGFSSGTVTLDAAVTNVTVTISRVLPVERTTDFPYSGPLSIRALNTELDKIIAMMQQTAASMVALGQRFTDWIALISTSLTTDVVTVNFATRNALSLATVSALTLYVRTAGLTDVDDGGGRIYVRAADATDAGPEGVSSNGGTFWWKPQYELPVTLNGEGGQWQVRKLRAQNNNFDANGLSMDISFASASFYNPNTRAIGRVAPGGHTTTITCDINTVGVNGRDQTAAFVYGDNLTFYLTLDPSGTVGTLASKTGPLATNTITGDIGPDLKGGHITFCPLFDVVVSDADSLFHDSRQGDEGTRAVFDGSMAGNVLTVGTWIGPATINDGARVRKYTGNTSSIVPNTRILAQLTSTEPGLVLGKRGTYQLTKSQPVPVGFDHWQSTTPFTTNFVVVGKTVYFSASILEVLDEFVGMDDTFAPLDTDQYDWPYQDFIPADAEAFELMLDPEISAKESAPGADDGLTTSGFFLTWRAAALGGSGNSLFLSMYAYGNVGKPLPNNLTAPIPVTDDMTVSVVWLQGGA